MSIAEEPPNTQTDSPGLQAARLLTERLTDRQTRRLQLGALKEGEALFADKYETNDTTSQAVLFPSYDGLGLVNVPNLIATALGVPLPADAVPPVALEKLADPLSPVDEHTSSEARLAAMALDARLCHLTGLDGLEKYRKKGYTNSEVTWPPLREVVLLIVDALGFTQLLELVGQGKLPTFARLIADPHNVAAPLTSAYPSTTTTVLSAYATGRTPQEHGIMATNVWLREVGEMVNLIGYTPSIGGSVIPDRVLNPDTLLPVETLYNHLDKNGVHTRHVNFQQYLNTSMSRMNLGCSNVETVAYVTVSGMFTHLRQELQKEPFDPSGATQSPKRFTYSYISTLDTTAHRYGPMTEQYEAEFAAIDFTLGHELLERVNRPDALLLIVADHGQVVVDHERTVYLNDDLDVVKLVRNQPGGERRTPYIYVDTADRPKLRAILRDRYGDRLSVMNREDAFDLGLFGPANEAAPGGRRDPRAVNRVGELIIFPKPGWQVRWLTREDRASGWNGAHGGLSADEMLTPLIATRLGQPLYSNLQKE